MAKKPITPSSAYLKAEQEHLMRLVAYQKQIEAIYNEAIREAAKLSASLDLFDPEAIFTFADYPVLLGRANKIFADMQSSMQACIVNGVHREWSKANSKNDLLAKLVLGAEADKLDEAQRKLFFTNNETALEAFLARKEKGLDLSDRVWKYTSQFKTEIEMGLDLGIRDGRSAAEMARDLKQYLQYPDKLFRRVRDEHGVLHLSQAAKEFHPGQGVYRSSFKNARRLAATETNMAYRTADHDRWQQMDFVVGVRIVKSNNHTTIGPKGQPIPLTDICDELSAPQNYEENDTRGLYPKDFVFTGWHPHCRCFAVPVLKTDEEIKADTQKLLRGEPIDNTSENTVTDTPEEFKEWCQENEERMSRATTQPYFIRDNQEYVQAAITGEIVPHIETPAPILAPAPALPHALQVAEERHASRTPEQIQSIQAAWDERRYRKLIDRTSNIASQQPVYRWDKQAHDYFREYTYGMPAGGTSHVERAGLLDRWQARVKELEHSLKVAKKAELRHAARTPEEIRRIMTAWELRIQGKEYVDNMAEVGKRLGIQRGQWMTFDQADHRKANWNYTKGAAYKNNCQSCVVADELRRRGYRVEAKGFADGTATDILSRDTTKIWIDPETNTKPRKKNFDNNKYLKGGKDAEKAAKTWIESITKERGRYNLDYVWEEGNDSGGHIITLERLADGTLRIYDPQNGKTISMSKLVGKLNFSYTHGKMLSILRVDNLHINLNMIRDIVQETTR